MFKQQCVTKTFNVWFQTWGGRDIVFEKEEVAAMKRFGDIGLSILGFKPKQQAVRRWHHVKAAQFIYPDEEKVKGCWSTNFTPIMDGVGVLQKMGLFSRYRRTALQLINSVSCTRKFKTFTVNTEIVQIGSHDNGAGEILGSRTLSTAGLLLSYNFKWNLFLIVIFRKYVSVCSSSEEVLGKRCCSNCKVINPFLD